MRLISAGIAATIMFTSATLAGGREDPGAAAAMSAIAGVCASEDLDISRMSTLASELGWKKLTHKGAQKALIFDTKVDDFGAWAVVNETARLTVFGYTPSNDPIMRFICMVQSYEASSSRLSKFLISAPLITMKARYVEGVVMYEVYSFSKNLNFEATLRRELDRDASIMVMGVHHKRH